MQTITRSTGFMDVGTSVATAVSTLARVASLHFLGPNFRNLAFLNVGLFLILNKKLVSYFLNQKIIKHFRITTFLLATLFWFIFDLSLHSLVLLLGLLTQKCQRMETILWE